MSTALRDDRSVPLDRAGGRVRRAGAALGLVPMIALGACTDAPTDVKAAAPAGPAGAAAPVHPAAPAGPGAPAGPATTVPQTAAAGPTPPRVLSLVATGDVLVHPRLWAQARRDASAGNGPDVMDFAPALAGVRPLVSAADLAICHLETPLAPAGGPYRGYPAFAAPPQVVAGLRATGYDACTTASNHSFDQGAAGVTRTLDALDRAGIAHAGTARSRREADSPIVLTVRTANGPVRVGLLSYTFGFNGVRAPGGQAWRANPIEPTRILRDAAAARRRGAELTVVALHWGDEYVQKPSAQQLALAPSLLASPDVDLLLGHHAHVAQPVERFGGEWVVYGLGNLVAAHGTRGAPLREGLLARFTFVEQRDGRFLAARAGYAPLLMTDAPPLRVLDVASASRTRAVQGVSPKRLAEAWSRTTAVVQSRGAAAAGLEPLSSPHPAPSPRTAEVSADVSRRPAG